jgi:hypothetical protein
MQQKPNTEIEDGVAVENPSGTASAHPDGIAARERDDAAGDRGGDGSFVEHRATSSHLLVMVFEASARQGAGKRRFLPWTVLG